MRVSFAGKAMWIVLLTHHSFMNNQQAIVPVCLHRTARALLALIAESHGFCLVACLYSWKDLC